MDHDAAAELYVGVEIPHQDDNPWEKGGGVSEQVIALEHPVKNAYSKLACRLEATKLARRLDRSFSQATALARKQRAYLDRGNLYFKAVESCDHKSEGSAEIVRQRQETQPRPFRPKRTGVVVPDGGTMGPKQGIGGP